MRASYGMVPLRAVFEAERKRDNNKREEKEETERERRETDAL